jgi:fatty acid desaturase
MNGGRYVHIAVMIVVAVAAVGMLGFTIQSVGQVPWWFLVAMALTAVNGAVVAYTMHLESAHGAASTIKRLNLVTRSLTWVMLLAVAAMLLKVR